MPRSREQAPLVLLADDDPHFLKVTELHLRGWLYRVVSVTDKVELLRELSRERPAVVLLDLQFGKFDGIEILVELIRDDPNLLVVILTAFGSIGNAVSSIKFGAFDYLTKPLDLDRLRKVVNHAVDENELRLVANLRAEADATPVARPILGQSRSIEDLHILIDKVGPTTATVLITGESGTGKEIVAHALHAKSRRTGPFVPINVSAVPRDLAESTLFGHERGAFTGAEITRKGVCEAADGGTLFLDEIGELELGLQAKLLRFLQEKTVPRIGRDHPIPVDTRVVAATNRDPVELIRNGSFREDLYYRLNVVPIQLTPLRERREDIPVLAERFLQQATTRHHRSEMHFTEEALAALTADDWPGNVRQLQNLVERLSILAPGPEIDVFEVTAAIGKSSSRGSLDFPTPPPLDAGGTDSGLSTMDRMEARAIRDALRQSNGNVKEAARFLGIAQATVYRKMKRYGITT